MQINRLSCVIILIIAVLVSLVALPSPSMAEPRFDFGGRVGAGFGEWERDSSKTVGAELGGSLGVMWKYLGVTADISYLMGKNNGDYSHLIVFALLLRGSVRPGYFEINPKLGIGGASGSGLLGKTVLQFDLGFDVLYRFDGYSGHALGVYAQAHLMPEARSGSSLGYVFTAGVTYRFGTRVDDKASSSTYYEKSHYDDDVYTGEDANQEIIDRAVEQTTNLIISVINAASE